MDTVLGFFLGMWALVGAAITAAIVFYGGVFVAGNPTPWNFPGDPPLFDLLVVAAAIAAAVNLPLAIVVNRFGPRRGLVLSLPRTCATLAMILFVISAAPILERHDARWREVRNGIRQYGDAIAAAAGSQGRLLTEEEFHRLHDQFMPEPIPVTLRGYGIVRLRMAHRVYPYVGVDFGGGANAIFEPRTMLCTYSD